MFLSSLLDHKKNALKKQQHYIKFILAIYKIGWIVALAKHKRKKRWQIINIVVSWISLWISIKVVLWKDVYLDICKLWVFNRQMNVKGMCICMSVCIGSLYFDFLLTLSSSQVQGISQRTLYHLSTSTCACDPSQSIRQEWKQE
jgi:hypothetical protein